MNNNQTCIHQAVAPNNIEECVHKENIDNICPICAYEIGFLAGCSNTLLSYEDFISSQGITANCSRGTKINEVIFDIIRENKNNLRKKICIYCSFKSGFDAARIKDIKNCEFVKVEMPHRFQVQVKD